VTQKKILVADDEKDIVELITYNSNGKDLPFPGPMTAKAWRWSMRKSRTSSSST